MGPQPLDRCADARLEVSRRSRPDRHGRRGPASRTGHPDQRADDENEILDRDVDHREVDVSLVTTGRSDRLATRVVRGAKRAGRRSLRTPGGGRPPRHLPTRRQSVTGERPSSPPARVANGRHRVIGLWAHARADLRSPTLIDEAQRRGFGLAARLLVTPRVSVPNGWAATGRVKRRAGSRTRGRVALAGRAARGVGRPGSTVAQRPGPNRRVSQRSSGLTDDGAPTRSAAEPGAFGPSGGAPGASVKAISFDSPRPYPRACWRT